MAETYRYPNASIGKESDYLNIAVFQYTANARSNTNTSLSDNGNNLISPGGATGSPIAIVQLPMPSNIQDSQQVAYGDDSLDIFGAFAGEKIMGAMQDIGGKLGSSGVTGAMEKGSEIFGNVAKSLGGQLGKTIGDAFTRNLAAQAAGILGANVTAQQILTRSQGKILNPNMELLFTAPTLRSFQFSFKMTPRDESERDKIKNIIRTFKKNMSPIDEGDYLVTPNVFKLTYKKGTGNHPFLNRFKDCALTDMSVNYTGENVYATYSDGTPVSIIMNLTFKELTPIYNSDYDEKDKTVGF